MTFSFDTTWQIKCQLNLPFLSFPQKSKQAIALVGYRFLHKLIIAIRAIERSPAPTPNPEYPMTNDQPKCKLSLAITKPGNRTNRLTVEITQEQAQSILEIVRQQYASVLANISSDQTYPIPNNQ